MISSAGRIRSADFYLSLIVLRIKLEIALCMVANRAYNWSILTYYDVTAVTALPDSITIA